jgi:hypothetical protein
MEKRKNEVSRLYLQVKANREKKNRDGLTPEWTTVSAVDDYFMAFKNNYKTFEKSVFECSDVSSKYQKIGIEKIAASKKGKYNFYHLAFGLIFKNQEEIRKIDVEDFTVNMVKLGSKEFQYITTFATIETKTNTIVLDNRCYNALAQRALNQMVIPYLRAEDFLLSPSELPERVNFDISRVLKKDFKKVLSQQFKRVQEVGMTFTKHNATVKNDEELEIQSNEQIGGYLQSLIAPLLGLSKKEIQFDKLPLARVRIELKFDENFEQSQLNNFKKNSAGFIEDIIEDSHLESSFVRYKNDEDEVVRAIKSGIGVSEPINLDPKHFSDASRMWEKQVQAFDKYKRYTDEKA